MTSAVANVSTMVKRSVARKPPKESAPPPVRPAAPGVEERLAELDGQFAQLKAEIRQAQQLAASGLAAASIAHEFNNLLSPILGYAQYALKRDDHELSRKALKATVKNVSMLVAMSDRVLAISAQQETKLQHVNLRSTVEDAAAALCRDLSKDGIRFVVNVEESLAVWADPLQLRQVFFNLFLNAREAMAGSHSGRLTVNATPDGDRVLIEVRDTGKGIEHDRLGGIFDVLQSSKASSNGERQRCSGLGLALCRDLVEECRGTITVSSNPGVGTTFTICLHGETPPGS